MLDQAKKISEIVRQKIPFGSSNIMYLDKVGSRRDLKSLVDFYRDLREQIYLQIFKTKAVSITGEREANLLDCFLSAILAEVYQTANCGEQSKLSLSQFILQGIPGVMEMIFIEDQESKMDHMFLLGNRDAKSDINNPRTWKDIILIDLWTLFADQIKQYPGYSVSLFSILALNPNIKKISKIKVELRIEKDLAPAEWVKLGNIFTVINPMVDEKIIAPLLEKHSLNSKLDAKNEVKKIQDKVYELVGQCHLRKKEFPTTVHSFKMFDINSKGIVEDKLLAITGKKWIYFPPNEHRKQGEARFISSNRSDIVSMIDFFANRKVELARKKLPDTNPPQFVAQFSAVTLEKLKKLEARPHVHLADGVEPQETQVKGCH